MNGVDPRAPPRGGPRGDRIGDLLDELVRKSRELNEHVHAEAVRADRVASAPPPAPPRPKANAPRTLSFRGGDPRAGISTLLELQQELRRGKPVEAAATFSTSIEQSRDSVQSMQKSIQSLNDVLAKRRAHRSAKQLLVVQVDPAALEEADELEAVAEREQAQKEAARAKKRRRHGGTMSDSLVRIRMVRLCLVLVMALIVSPFLARVMPVSAFAVATDSMEPAIPKGALVMARDREPMLGDIVVYRSPYGEFQVHRVVEKFELDGEPAYTTRGDANEASDSFTVMRADVAGVVVRTSEHVGQLWIIPMVYKLGTLMVLIVAYIAITLADRPLRSRARRVTRVLATAMVFLTVLPGAWGAVYVAGPPDGFTVDVNDPSPIPFVAGSVGSSSIGGDENSATATVGEVALWKEIVMWGCVPTNHAAAGCIHAPPAAYAAVAASVTLVDLTKYAPDPTFFLEAYLKADLGETVFVQLFDKTDAAVVAGTELSTTSTNLVLVRSAAFTLPLDSSHEYQFQTMNNGPGAGGEVRMVKLITKQIGATDTVTQIIVSSAARTSGVVAFTQLARSRIWENEESEFDGTVSIYSEIVGSGFGQVRLRDTDAPGNRHAVTFSAAALVRARSGNIAGSLVDGAVHEVQGLNDPLQNVDVHMARIIIEQTGLGSGGATETLRYVDLAARETSASEGYLFTGHDAAYQMTSEWEATQGIFEANVLNVLAAAGTATFARLYDRTAAAAVAGSEVSISSSTLQRLRSPLVNLNAADGNYAAQFRTSNGASDAEIRHAWIIIPQTVGKTFDHVLRSDRVSGTCTWEFTLVYDLGSGTNLGRLDNARIMLSNDASTEDQIIISAGAVTQETGAAVTWVAGPDIQHVVYSDPNAAGTSTVDAWLLGACQGTGIHTNQTVTYEIG